MVHSIRSESKNVPDSPKETSIQSEGRVVTKKKQRLNRGRTIIMIINSGFKYNLISQSDWQQLLEG